jgi:hypothetical protein
MRPDDDTSPGEDELLPRLLRALGPQPTLPDDMKHTWAATFSRELMKRNALRRQQRRRAVGLAGAAVALLAVAVAVVNREPPALVAVAQIVAAIGPNEASGDRTTVPLRAGDGVAAGQTVRTGADGYLALRYHDVDVRLKSDTVVVTHPTGLELMRGALYVDAGSTPSGGPTLLIETAFGTLAHVGTQFVVTLTDSQMRAAVREGSIAISAAGTRRTVSAVDGAREAVIADGVITVNPIAPVGGIWDWVVTAAPGYPIDGVSADQFLTWAARQLGAKLDYASEATRVHARLVVLHGDVHTSVSQGLAAIDSTTDLATDRSDPTRLYVVQR